LDCQDISEPLAADGADLSFFGFRVVVIDGWDPDQVAIMSHERALLLKQAIEAGRRLVENVKQGDNLRRGLAGPAVSGGFRATDAPAVACDSAMRPRGHEGASTVPPVCRAGEATDGR
jgi:hypothetical protein